MACIEFRKLASVVYHQIWDKVFSPIKLSIYWKILPSRVKRIRQKGSICVLFVTSELSSWKTELLYKKMICHPRFHPIIGVSTSYAPRGIKLPLINYLQDKGFDYVDLDLKPHSIDLLNPDIIFYNKPYPECYSKGHFFYDNLKYVFCGLDYCIEATKHAAHIYREFFDYCWLFFVENNELAKRRKEVLGSRARNTRITGTPIQDVFMQPKEDFNDPWKDQSKKKRIIYAPHHSIPGTNGDGIEFSTFLDYGETVLKLAKKYKNDITVAFKPHPNLYMKLVKIWGKNRTEAYYNEWLTMENAQVETGEYIGLFKYSDAIIHDCASFIVEYLYTNNPSLYLVANTNNIADMFDFVREGYHCHEHAYNAYEIENFICDVIKGNDNKKEKREHYIKTHLIPPGSHNACDNIIEAILG